LQMTILYQLDLQFPFLRYPVRGRGSNVFLAKWFSLLACSLG